MSGFNQVILLGRLGNDPETKYTQGGTAVVSLSLATSRRQKKRGSDEYEEITSWHRVKAFGKQAEVIAEHCGKGDLLFVEGRLDYWQADGSNGGKLSVAEIILEHFEFTGGGRRSEGGGNEGGRSRPSSTSRSAPAPRGATRAPRPTTQQPMDDFTDDDIPF